MKLEIKSVPDRIPLNEFVVCLVRADEFLFEGLPESYQDFAEQFRKGIQNNASREPLVVPVAGSEGRGFVFLTAPESIEYFSQNEAVKILASDALAKAEGLNRERLIFLVNTQKAESLIPLLAEGVVLGGYRFDRYKSDKNDKKRKVEQVVFYSRPAALESLRKKVRETARLGDLVNRAREITNEPGGIMTPAAMAQYAKHLARNFDLECRILNEKQLKKEGYNGLLTVGAGSVHPPRMVVLTYHPRRSKSKKHLCVVGKGLTFDTGGINLKPNKDMLEMKADMAGAAAVLHAVAAIAERALPLPVTAIAPLAENAIGSRATLPGHIFRAKNGKSIQVDNPDAEGRLVLTDALALAGQLKPTHLVDLATLTGACSIALGTSVSGLFGDDPAFNKIFLESAEEVGEPCWELPLYREYLQLLKCDYADLINYAGTRDGGAITAALFLSEFKPKGIPWIHLDIAGTNYITKPWKYLRPGATGVGVRTLLRLAERLSGE